MRIIVHAGLHKSGTTSLQACWNAAYADHDRVRYPRRPPGRPPGHHELVRPLLAAFTERRDVDLVAASLTRSLRPERGQTLSETVERARSEGVDTLLLSSEDLDRVVTEDRPALENALSGSHVTAVLTLTRPVHRWCSGWQTLVKHGLAQYPRDAESHVVNLMALQPGRLAEILDVLPADRRLVRLVRTTPPEPDLAADLAGALGLPDARDAAGHPMLNTSLGVDTEVVLRMNRADLALGTSKEGKRILAELRGHGFAYRDAPELAGRYELPETAGQGADDEASWLRSGAVEVLDPHALLDSWADATVPDWYAAISRREAVVPALDDARADDRETQLWRVRQEREAFQRRLARVQKAPG